MNRPLIAAGWLAIATAVAIRCAAQTTPAPASPSPSVTPKSSVSSSRAPARPPAPPTNLRIVNNPVDLVITRHGAATLDDSGATSILNYASKALQDVDGPDDVTCDIKFGRSGPVRAVAGLSVINSDADFDQICRAGGNVHVVKEINFCGGPGGGTIVGCADQPGTCMAVVRHGYTYQSEALIWAHEYGHNKGLPHRRTAFAIMYPSLNESNRRVNLQESRAYINRSLFAALTTASVIPSSGAPDAGGVTSSPAVPADIREFVRQTFVHGVPYEQARHYPATDIPKLVQILDDTSEATHHANAVLVACMIATDDSITDDIISRLERGVGRVSDSDYNEKKSALIGLGYLANRGKSPKAVAYLKASLDPAVWNQRVRWETELHATAAELHAQLSTLAVWGLAISGEPDARTALESLRSNKARNFLQQSNGLLDEALSVISRVQQQGLLEYSKRAETP